MKILFLNNNVAYRGGATFYRALNLAQRLAKRGHAVTLIASSYSRIARFSIHRTGALTLVEAPGMMPGRWRYGYDIYDALRRVLFVAGKDYDLVHAFDSRPTVIYPALRARRNGACLVMDWCDWFGRGGAVEERPNPLMRALLRKPETYFEESFRHLARLNTVINHALYERSLGLGIPESRLFFLPNGSDTQKIQRVDKTAARAALNLHGPGLILGYMGSLFKADASLLLEAFQKVRQEFPQARLVCIGNTKMKIPAADSIIKTGFVSAEQLNLFLCACDIFLMPQTDTVANQGRWPSKLNDYMAAGRPVISTSVGEAARMVAEEDFGLSAAPSAAALAQAIIELASQPLKMEEMGKNARRLAEGRFNWDQIVQDLETQYLRLI